MTLHRKTNRTAIGTRKSRLTLGREGVDFVRCRICGARRRVIATKHLSTHDIERETYIEECGLSPDDLIAKDFRRIQSSRRDFRPYNKREWLAAMKAARTRNPSAFASGNVEKRFAQLYRHGRWLFGNWNKALRAAGLNPERTRQRKSWDRDAVTEKIRALRKKQVPLTANWVMKNYSNLFSAALRHFESWNEALIGAGVIKKPVIGKNRLGLLRELRELMERSSAGIPEPLQLPLTLYFGSVSKPISALKTEPKLLNGWSTTKIIVTLKRMHRLKQPLAYGSVRRERMALVSAAEAYFGSWGRALHAAGIDPNRYFIRQKWRLRA